MRIIAIGLIVIPLGFYLFARGKRPLFWALVWSLPFFDTIILYLPFAPLRPFQYFAGLLFARFILDALSTGRIPSLRTSSATLSGGLFLLAVLFSLFMPALITAPIYIVPEGVSSVAKAYTQPEVLQFSFKNVTQLLYPLFGILLFLALQRLMRDVGDLRRVIRILTTSFFVLAGVMIAYQVLFVLGLPEPVQLFFRLINGKAASNFSEYNALGSLGRAFTPAGEPGFTGIYYVLVLGLLFGLAYGGYEGAWRPKHSKRLVGGVAVALVLNASTTGFFGMAMLIAGFLLVTVLRQGSRVPASSNVRVILRVVGASVLAGGMIIVVVQVVFGLSLAQVIMTQHLAKLTEAAGSGAIRLHTIVYSMEEVFAASPILGVGYGSHRALSLLISLLANTGIVGTLLFLLFNGVIFRHAIVTMNRTAQPDLAALSFALSVAHVGILPTLLVAKSETGLSFGWLWLLLAMMEACYWIYRREEVQLVPARSA